MSRFDVFHKIKRRAKAAALPYSTCCRTFPATGIATYLENGTLNTLKPSPIMNARGPPSSMIELERSLLRRKSGELEI